MPIKIQTNQSLSQFSTLKIGGLARFFVVVHSLKEVKSALLFASRQHIPFFILGKGSNCLFDDRGYNGLIILNKLDYCRFDESVVEVSSGYSFAILGAKASKRGLSGLEFAAGIPASVGGAIYMNASANNQETFACLESVSYINEQGQLLKFKKKDLEYGYRFTCFHAMKGYIIDASFKLKKDPSSPKRKKELVSKRLDSQPYKDKSAGCAFRNPAKDVAAGYLIEKCGLKNKQIGGAAVSKKHANFVLNVKQASSKDVLDLIACITKEVFVKTGHMLQTEIQYVPYESK